MNWSSFCLGVLATSLYLGLPLWLSLPLMALIAVLPEMLVSVLYPSSAKFNGARRRMMVSTWSDPTDPSINCELLCDAAKVQPYLEKVSKETGEKITVTHLVVKALGLTLREAPGMRGRLVFSRFVPFDTVDISCLVVMEKTNNLSVSTVKNVDKLPLQDIAGKVRGEAERLRSEKDKDFQKTVKVQGQLPTCVLRTVAWVTGFVSNALGVDLPALGAKRFHFGSCIVTSLGSIGLDKADVPLTPFARTPILVSVGLMKLTPVVEGEGEDAKVVPKLMLPLGFTIDHRFVDGIGTLSMAKNIKRIIENPEIIQADGSYKL